MNNNNVYAYLLLGAVVLAGIGGFMFSDSLFADEPVSSGPSYSTAVLSWTVAGADIDSITEDANNGQEETG